MNRISVVIPVFNAEETILDCLETLEKYSSKYSLGTEVIIVDAGSSDRTIALAEKYAQKVIVQPGVSRGEARNLGAKASTSEVLVFLDSDCMVTSEWAKYLSEASVRLDSNVLAGPSVLSETKSYAGTAMRDLLSNSLLTSSSLTFCEISVDQQVFDVPTSNLVISKEFFSQIGGFPNVNYNEDNIFCKQVKSSGGKIMYSPKLKVLHERIFGSVSDFSSYLFAYGKAYANSVKHCPEIINRYFFFALFFYPLIALIIGISIIMAELVPFMFIVLLVGFLGLIPYSWLKIRRSRSSFLIPPLFVVLLFSYCSGFVYGLIHRNRD